MMPEPFPARVLHALAAASDQEDTHPELCAADGAGPDRAPLGERSSMTALADYWREFAVKPTLPRHAAT